MASFTLIYRGTNTTLTVTASLRSLMCHHHYTPSATLELVTKHEKGLADGNSPLRSHISQRGLSCQKTTWIPFCHFADAAPHAWGG